MTESTIVGTPAPAHLPAVAYPEYREPDQRDREWLLDVAAAACRDSYPLVGDRGLVEAICRDYGITAGQLRDEYERADMLTHDLATAEVQLEIARGVAAKALLELAAARNELAAARNELEDLRLMLATERSRLERESQAHQQTIQQLAAATVESYGLGRKLEVAVELRDAALADAERMRGCAIRSSESEALARHAVAKALLRPSLVFDVSDIDTDVVSFDDVTPVPARTITPRVPIETMAALVGGDR